MEENTVSERINNVATTYGIEILQLYKYDEATE